MAKATGKSTNARKAPAAAAKKVATRSRTVKKAATTKKSGTPAKAAKRTTPPKKSVKSTVRTAASKKSVPAKRPAAKKPAAKSTAKAASKKPVAKKPAAKSTAKAASKKPIAKKPAAKSVKAPVKATVKKPAPAPKAAAPAKKVAPAKAKPAPKPKKQPAGKTCPLSGIFVPKQAPNISPKTLEKLRELLIEERARHLHQAVELQADADLLVNEREQGDTQFDEESGEGDTISVERERDLMLSANARQAVEEIDRALERMDNGTYGVCVPAGRRIVVARLEAIPADIASTVVLPLTRSQAVWVAGTRDGKPQQWLYLNAGACPG